MLTKESAILFPLFLAAADWTFSGQKPWQRGRRGVYWGLGAAAALYLLGRWLLLPRLIHGGLPYFTSGRLVAALTLAKFAAARYLPALLAGGPLCSDYSRPLIPDAGRADALAWLCLALWLLAAAAALRALRRRQAWGFWALAPLVFLLPTSNLLFPLDTLAAERWLYLPSLGWGAALAALYQRALPRPAARLAVALLLACYGLRSRARAADFSSRLSYYRAASRCNPVSYRARSGLAAALLERGEEEAGEAELGAALRLNPSSGIAHANLALLAWRRGRPREAERLAREAVRLNDSLDEPWVVLGLCAEGRRRPAEAARAYVEALARRPGSAAAHYNLGRLLALAGRRQTAAAHLAAFLELAPDDADAPAARRLLRGLAAAEARR